jgi:hypothetical protein
MAWSQAIRGSEEEVLMSTLQWGEGRLEEAGEGGGSESSG